MLDFFDGHGLERAAPVRRLVQKLRAGEQFLARGRVLCIEDTSLADGDTMQKFGLFLYGVGDGTRII